MTAPHRQDDSPSFMAKTLDRLAAKETDEFRVNVLLALSELSTSSVKTAGDVADLKAGLKTLDSKVKVLEDRSGEIHELRQVNDRQDKEIDQLRVRVKMHEERAKAAWWALAKVAAIGSALAAFAWGVYEKFSK